MSDNSVRGWLEDKLKPVLPQGWRLLPNHDMPETIDRVTVVLKLLSFVPLAAASKGYIEAAVTVTIADPRSDPKRAEDALDEEVIQLVLALDSIAMLTWSEAKKVEVGAYLGWDITTSIISRKEV